MSMTQEHAEHLRDKPAVVCCRVAKGTAITAAELEDPAIFPDLAESGLIAITADTLSIGQVLGAVTLRDVDGLTGLTAEMLQGVNKNAAAQSTAAAATVAAATAALPTATGSAAGTTVSPETSGMSGVPGTLGAMASLYLKADQINGLELTIPLGGYGAAQVAGPLATGVTAGEVEKEEHTGKENKEAEHDETLSTLEQRLFTISDLRLGERTAYENGVLTVREDVVDEAVKVHPGAKAVKIHVVRPDNLHVHTDTIMDIMPVAAKIEGEVGYGVTHVVDNMICVLTGQDEAGNYIKEFGSSAGFMDETIIFGLPGCPDHGDFMLCVNVTIETGTCMERRGPMAAHTVCDAVLNEVRGALKKLDPKAASGISLKEHIRRHGRPRVLLVKEIMGQGAMHDNVLLPMEPGGVLGGRSNVDLGNIPVMLNINELRDGGVHSLCCVGPSSKEMTRHNFREPLAELMAADPELNLVGVVFIGSPQVNSEKLFISKRLGAMADALNIAGCVVTTEGFGNNHIDFASHIEQMGKRGIKVVGVTYSAYQGQLVVGNKYMDTMVELNKDVNGLETELLGENTMTAAEAARAVAMLKNRLAGVEIGPPAGKWTQSLIDRNIELVEAGSKVQ